MRTAQAGRQSQDPFALAQDEPAAADGAEVSEPVRLSDFVAEEEEPGKADADADSSR